MSKGRAPNRSSYNGNLVEESSFKNKFLLFGTILTSIIYMLWRFFYTIPFEFGTFALVIGIMLLLVEFIGLLESIEHYYSMSNVFIPKRPNPPKEWFPDVDVFIATYNEPVELLRKTINGCKNMDYNDKEKVHIYICDDGNRTEMKQLADKMGVGYITRDIRKDMKAGNLNHALSVTNSPLVVTFDADMIPLHNFLIDNIPFFYMEKNDVEVGFIQTPQTFYNPDLFQHNLFSESRIPDEQDYFYRDIQVSRNKTNSVIYGGTNTILSRKALEGIGGFCTGVITEDFATGILIQNNGYVCYAIDTPYAIGQAPYDLKSLIKQRIRWARGCIQTGRKLNILFLKGLSVNQKISYISSIIYWYSPVKRLIYISAPILFTVFNIVVVKCTIFEVLLFWLPMYLFQNAALKQMSKGIRNTRWTSIYEVILFPALLIPVLLETFGLKMSTFSVTRKDGAVEHDRTYGYIQALPHLILAIFTFIGVVNSVQWIFNNDSLTYIVLVFWLLTNLYTLVMSIFFMLGRPVLRKAERFKAEIDCEIKWDNISYSVKTKDISESGISISMDTPAYIPDKETINVKLSTPRKTSYFIGEIVSVRQLEKQWIYAISIISIEDSEFDNLCSIVYDRVPSLPTKLEENSLFEDLSINILKRLPKPEGYNRKLARITVEKNYQSQEFGEVKIVDFNYEYILLTLSHNINIGQELSITISNNLKLKCQVQHLIETTDISSIKYVCKVMNLKEILYHSDFNAAIKTWLIQDELNNIATNKKNRTKQLDEFNELDYL